MEINPEKIQANIRQANSVDLLDRCTFYREIMEPDALEWIEKELRERGIGEEEKRNHFQQLAGQTIPIRGGGVESCSLCHRPAIMVRQGWHRLLGLVPLFPRRFFYCPDHLPD